MRQDADDSLEVTGDRRLRGDHGCSLELAHRGTQSSAFTRGGVGTETLPHSLADAELQFRVRLGRVIGRGLEKLVRQSEFEDGPEGLPVLPRKGAGGVRQVVSFSR